MGSGFVHTSKVVGGRFVKKEERRPGDTRRGNGATPRGARALEAPERSASCHTSPGRPPRAGVRAGARPSPRPPRPAISEILRQAHAYHCASIDTLYNGNLSHAAAHNTSLASPQYTTHILENRIASSGAAFVRRLGLTPWRALGDVPSTRHSKGTRGPHLVSSSRAAPPAGADSES